MVSMPQDEMECARSGDRGVNAPGDAQSRTTGPRAATSTLGLDGGDEPWRQSRPLPPGGVGRRV